jgi:ribosomal protein S18 acetylase RimI-like enzyme
MMTMNTGTVEVERLKNADRLEMLELFAQAFKNHPLIPALDAKPEATGPLMKAFLDCFGGVKNALMYGIRKEHKLVCASVSLDSKVEPSKPALMRFVLALYRALGWRIAREFEVVHKEEPPYEDRYLELLIFGTLPSYQRQGLGRKMLNFLYKEAKKEGYNGMILVTDRNAPAFQLYSKEGFIVDKEFAMGEAALCWMRLAF